MTEEEFFQNIPKWISEEDFSKWNHVTLQAYFCYKYEKSNGVRFKMVRSKAGPTNTKETKDLKKVFLAFAPENYEDLPSDEKKLIREKINKKVVDYINWTFDYKFRQKGQSVNGTQIMLAPSLINEFERMYSIAIQKAKQKNTIQDLMIWCQREIPEIFKKHQLEEIEHLRIIQKYAESYHLDSQSMESKLIVKSQELGLL